jgi:hypothetical protein
MHLAHARFEEMGSLSVGSLVTCGNLDIIAIRVNQPIWHLDITLIANFTICNKVLNVEPCRYRRCRQQGFLQTIDKESLARTICLWVEIFEQAVKLDFAKRMRLDNNDVAFQDCIALIQFDWMIDK